jgi:hypothetical protein
MTPEQIAEVSHEANRAYTRHTQDVPVQPAWPDVTAEMRASAISGVKWRLANQAAPASASHDEWMKFKTAGGWKFGPVRSDAEKTHPALVPYNDLAPAVKAKDALFTAIVLALS